MKNAQFTYLLSLLFLLIFSAGYAQAQTSVAEWQQEQDSLRNEILSRKKSDVLKNSFLQELYCGVIGQTNATMSELIYKEYEYTGATIYKEVGCEDLYGKRQGKWQLYKLAKPQNVILYGNYVDGHKDGLWYASMDGREDWVYEEWKNGLRLEENYYYFGDKDKVLMSRGWQNEEGISCGLFELFHENGNLHKSGCFDSGKKNGEWKTYYPDGTLESVGSYDYNKFVGLWKWFYPDGVVKFEGEYVNNYPDGEWMWYYPTGEQWVMRTYIEGDKTGKWQGWYSDGSKCGEAIYNKGLIVGKSIFYNLQTGSQDTLSIAGKTLQRIVELEGLDSIPLLFNEATHLNDKEQWINVVQKYDYNLFVEFINQGAIVRAEYIEEIASETILNQMMIKTFFNDVSENIKRRDYGIKCINFLYEEYGYKIPRQSLVTMFGHRGDNGDKLNFVGNEYANYFFSKSDYNAGDKFMEGNDLVSFLDIVMNCGWVTSKAIQYLILSGVRCNPKHIEKAEYIKRHILNEIEYEKQLPSIDRVYTDDLLPELKEIESVLRLLKKNVSK